MNSIKNLMNKLNKQVVEINTENNSFICDDGVEYPYYGGDISQVTIDQLQLYIDNAKTIIASLLNTDDGKTAES